MGKLSRDRLPDPVSYFEGEGLILRGPGKWKSTSCRFHNGSDSLRVNVQSGGWCCMACHAKGGDVLSYAMQAHNLEFIDAARLLGAWVDDGKPSTCAQRSALLSARDALQLVCFELLVTFVVIADIRSGVIPTDGDWRRFVEAAGRIEVLAMEYRS